MIIDGEVEGIKKRKEVAICGKLREEANEQQRKQTDR